MRTSIVEEDYDNLFDSDGEHDPTEFMRGMFEEEEDNDMRELSDLIAQVEDCLPIGFKPSIVTNPIKNICKVKLKYLKLHKNTKPTTTGKEQVPIDKICRYVV